MNVITRKFAAVVLSATAILSAGAATTATLLITHRAGHHATAPALKTADYNDGWLDGQADLADQLGHRMPSAADERALIAGESRTGSHCILTWTGPVTASYAVSCAR